MMPRLKKKWTSAVSAPVVPPVSVTPAFLGVEQAAVYLSVTTWTVRRLIKTRLAAKKIGRRLIVKRADLDLLWESEPVFAGKRQRHTDSVRRNLKVHQDTIYVSDGAL
jgi:excisionase family DNA binding protein